MILNECWPAPAMVVEGIHVEDIFELVSLVLSLIISWTFEILVIILISYFKGLSDVMLRDDK